MRLQRIFLKFKEQNKEYRKLSSQLYYQSYFIRYYLYLQLRKHKFETDGTFNGISIEFEGESHQLREFHLDTIHLIVVNLTFDYEFYANADQTQRCNYLLYLYKAGIRKVATYKSIPEANLISDLTMLAENGFVCRWNFKNLSISEHNLKVKFICELNIKAFLLKAQVFKKGIKEPICEGVAVRTKPDYFYFNKISKNIVVKDNKVIISNKLGSREFFNLDLNDLKNGKFEVKLLPPPPEMTDSQELDYFYSFRESLMYDNDEFK